MSEIHIAINRILAISEQFVESERPIFGSHNNTENISALLRLLPGPLPEDYMEFLVRCDGIRAMNIWNGYWIGGIESTRRMIERQDIPKHISNGKTKFDVIPIATDGGGNVF